MHWTVYLEGGGGGGGGRRRGEGEDGGSNGEASCKGTKILVCGLAPI